MRAEHERFEAMAVGHVLGGLEPAAANNFREHLLGCRSCRARVAELRDLAADLAAVERDERMRAAARPDGPADADQVAADASFEPAGAGLRTRNLALLAALVAVALGLFGFWNLHLRVVAANAQAVAQRQEQALAVLAVGVTPPTEVADGLQAATATDGDHLGFSLKGIPALGPDEVLVGWRSDGALDRPEPVLLVEDDQVIDGLVAARIRLDGAERFVLARESRPPGDEPGGTPLLTVRFGPANPPG